MQIVALARERLHMTDCFIKYASSICAVCKITLLISGQVRKLSHSACISMSQTVLNALVALFGVIILDICLLSEFE